MKSDEVIVMTIFLLVVGSGAGFLIGYYAAFEKATEKNQEISFDEMKVLNILDKLNSTNMFVYDKAPKCVQNINNTYKIIVGGNPEPILWVTLYKEEQGE